MARKIFSERAKRSLFAIPPVLILLFISTALSLSPRGSGGRLDSCTSILVGKLASADGSAMTSHSCDSNTDRTWMNIIHHKKHDKGEMASVWLEPKETKGPDDSDRVEVGKIPQIEEEALRLFKGDPSQAEAFLTRYCHQIANKAVEAYWKLGDDFWSKYNNLF